MSKTFTQSDVSSHNKPDSLWIVVDGDVYDVTKFQDDHPGMSSLFPPLFSHNTLTYYQAVRRSSSA